MAEPRKNHLTIDGGQVKDDEHVASYKPIPETDTGKLPYKILKVFESFVYIYLYF